MIIDTKAYGSLEIDRRQIVKFSKGLLGFEFLQEFALIDAKEHPFYWLQSLKDKKTAFVLIDPLLFRPDYKGVIDPSDIEDLDLAGVDDQNCLQFVIVNIPEDQYNMTANLQGPVFINKKNRSGRQCIAQDDRWHVRHKIFEELEKNGKKI